MTLFNKISGEVEQADAELAAAKVRSSRFFLCTTLQQGVSICTNCVRHHNERGQTNRCHARCFVGATLFSCSSLLP